MNNELDVALLSTLLHDKCPTKKYYLKKKIIKFEFHVIMHY
jgi:hypothetical protein